MEEGLLTEEQAGLKPVPHYSQEGGCKSQLQWEEKKSS